MALDIVRLYISLLSEFFTFSDAGVASSSATEHVPAYVPPTSDSLTTGLYVLRILTEITDCVGEVAGVDISPAASSSLKDLVASARWSFQEAICGAWARDSHIFHKIEDWTLSPDVPSTTIYLNRLATFQLHNTNTAYLVAGGSERSPSSRKTVRYSVALVSRTFLTQPTLQSELPSKFVIKIKTAFFDTLYYLLDGLVNLVFEYTPLHQEKPSALGGITLPKGQTPTLDVTDLVRCPLTSVVVQD